VRIPVVVLSDDLPLPAYARPGDAGLDLLAAADITIDPGGRALIPTGIAVAIPEGYAGFVHARSGRALNEGLAMANAPGLIDSGYRGELRVVAVNLDPREPIYVKRGEKVAQLVIQRVERVVLDPVESLPPSERGEGGFGHSGR
jgi:dUTP pyrophosphatase